MKTQIKHTCGHTAEYTLKKKGSDHWLRKQPCRRCQENRNIAQFERSQHLPALRGTEKQIQWASRIRYRILSELYKMRAQIPIEQTGHPKAAAFLKLYAATTACTSAKAWINRCDFTPTRETINAILTKGQPA